jgi:hypothetical protein
MQIDEHKVDVDGNKWSAFGGSGARLSGKPMSATTPLNNGTDSAAFVPPVSDTGSAPAILRLPKNKLWFGYKAEPFKKAGDAAAGGDDKPSGPTFSGAGKSLRAS